MGWLGGQVEVPPGRGGHWEAAKAARQEDMDDKLERVMLIRMMQDFAINFAKKHDVDTSFVRAINSILEKMLYFTNSVKTMVWKNLS